LNENEIALLQNYKPSLIYGRAKPEAPDNFVPATVAFDKKVLRFYGYFKQTVYESPNEYYRVRPVTICYFLEDDSMQVYESPVENSGIPQVNYFKRVIKFNVVSAQQIFCCFFGQFYFECLIIYSFSIYMS
jgi:hypothetical protein